jgi:tripartite-type tricarboxylate transporter receptor subunit TctC
VELETAVNARCTLPLACRALLAAVAITAAIAPAGPAAHAQEPAWPSKVIRLIVPFPPGGGFDGISRPFAERLGAALGHAVIIDNRPGAAGNIGAEIAARAAPDGYTLLFANTFLTTNPALYKALPYDPIRDFAPISRVGLTLSALSVHPSVPARNLKELMAYSQSKPLNYGTPGIGTSAHLVGEMLNLDGTLRTQHIPYKGTGQAISDAVGGQIDLVIGSLGLQLQFLRAGKLRGIAVMGPSRSMMMPDLPTLSEQGVPVQTVNWYALFAPARTPDALLRRLNATSVQVLAQPELIERLRVAGYETGSSTPEALAALLRTEIEMWRRVVMQAGIPQE